MSTAPCHVLTSKPVNMALYNLLPVTADVETGKGEQEELPQFQVILRQ